MTNDMRNADKCYRLADQIQTALEIFCDADFYGDLQLAAIKVANAANQFAKGTASDGLTILRAISISKDWTSRITEAWQRNIQNLADQIQEKVDEEREALDLDYRNQQRDYAAIRAEL